VSKISIEKLVFLCIITTIIITTVSLSKFETTINNDNTAKVAIYAIDSYSEGNTDKHLKIDCAGEKNLNLAESCTYVITNEINGKVTEVAVAYKIKIEFEEELPLGISIGVKDENGIEANVTTIGNSYIFENEAWKFTPGTLQTNNINITFNGENVKNATSTTISNVQVSVITEQID